MTHKPIFLAVVTGVLSPPFFASESFGFSLFSENTHSGSAPVIASGLAIALMAGGYYWLQRVRRISESQERREHSDELFDTENDPRPACEEGSEPLVMQRRSNPLPLPKPQPRPQDALNSLEPIPLQAATIPMPAKVQPKGANADDASKMILADQGMTSILLGGGMFYSADDQGNDVACSGFDGRMD